MKETVKFFTIFCMAWGLFSCGGDDGEVGPQGPQGNQGPQGIQGEAGTANVTYSDWMSVNYLSGGAQQNNIMGLEIFKGSEFNLDTDVALVYGRKNSGTNAGVYALPFSLNSQSEYYYYVLAEGTGGTHLQVRVTTTDGGTNLFTYFDEYRYVVIPGGTAASAKSSTKGGISQAAPDYTKMNYGEIAKLFNISE
ncbi:collagen-like protein [Marinilongibacter aquaticus]|uniref:collagen-like protein n=1 Tax=Marinilongibacter aquaticus TaxID=2975157 RepID=UPI0021BD0ED0|nr:collagen-like protein [Marinilongibacter aquaticus]UBM58794.1 collagen-like protein [Marinilongibacter aquaticus]